MSARVSPTRHVQHPVVGGVLPPGLEPGEDCIWTYGVTEEMLRSFFDDLEDKGAEHLGIRKAKMRKVEIRDQPDLDEGDPTVRVTVALALGEWL